MAKLPSMKRLIGRLEAYIEGCKNTDSKKPVFANVAGFCRYSGISVTDLVSLKRTSPEKFDIIAAYFEDAALNSGVTASLVGMYLRQYGLWAAPPDQEVVCDHDMFADGV